MSAREEARRLVIRAPEGAPVRAAALAMLRGGIAEAAVRAAAEVDARAARAVAAAGVELAEVPGWLEARGHRLLDEEPVLCCPCGWYAGRDGNHGSGSAAWIEHCISVLEDSVMNGARPARGDTCLSPGSTGHTGGGSVGS